MSTAQPKWETLETSLSNSGVLLVKFNRPKRKNAFNTEMYDNLVDCFNWATKNDQVGVVVLTGNGDYYSSGNDLSGFMGADFSNKELLEKELEVNRNRSMRFIASFYRFPKILIAAVNGPAIGIGATHLSHCDFIFMSKKATIHTPFVQLAQVPEACSSTLFPLIMVRLMSFPSLLSKGKFKANELLLLGKKMTSTELERYGFANGVYEENELLPKVLEIAESLAQGPREALLNSKKLINNEEWMNYLDSVNKREITALVNSWTTSEFMEAIMKFMSRKGNL